MPVTTNPTQVIPPKWLIWDGVEFPSAEAAEYIEHDFNFGTDDGLPVEGDVLEVHTLRGRVLYAACIPADFLYQPDWDNPAVAEPVAERVLKWRLEWHATMQNARSAIEAGVRDAEWTPDDCGGTYGIHDPASVAA